MGDVVNMRGFDLINIDSLSKNNRKIQSGLILPPKEVVEDGVFAKDHAAEPIKSMDDIMRVSEYFLNNGRYRDNMLFIVGINFGLRVSDLRQLRFCSIISENMTFKTTFPVFEIKTRNTRKKKKNRYITINSAVIEAVTIYLQNTQGVCLSDYMFRSESNHGSNLNEPLSIKSIDRILKKAAEDLELPVKVSTHTLRKTFAYHQMVMSNNDPRKLMLLSKMFGHSSVAITMDYIGITGEEIEKAYQDLNLGSYTHNYLNSQIEENESAAS